MPKQKTHSGAKKRFKITGSGKIMKQQAGMRRLVERRPQGRDGPLVGHALALEIRAQ